MTTRAPSDELRNLQREKVVDELFDDKIVGDANVRCGKAEFGKGKVKAIHAECDLVFKFAEIGLFQRRAIANNERAFAFVNVFQRSKALDAIAPPRVEVYGGQFRNAAKAVVGVSNNIPDRGRDAVFEGLFYAQAM